MANESIEFLIVLREEARKCFEKGMTYQEAYDKLDWSKFKKWIERSEKEKPAVANWRDRDFKGDLATIFSEFSGNPPGTTIIEG